MINADSFFLLLETLSRLTRQFQQVTTSVAGVLALQLLMLFLHRAMGEQEQEAAVLRAIGRIHEHVLKKNSAKAMIQGFIGDHLECC